MMFEQIQNFLEKNNKLSLLTRSYRNRNKVQVSYIFENSKIYLVGRSDNIHIEHIKYNHKVVVKIEYQNQNLTIRGLARITKDVNLKEKYLNILAERDGITPQGIYGLELVEISLLELYSEELNIDQIFPENQPSKTSSFFRNILLTFQFWIRATRLPFVSVSVMGVIVGTGVAFFQSKFMNSWLNFILAFLGIMFFHISVDLLNDFSDHKSGLDKSNIQQTPFSGGSRIIQNKLLHPNRVLLAALTSLAFCISIGLFLNFTVADNIILYIGIVGAFLGIFYVGVPFKLVYYGLGELAIFISFGPAIVLGSYYVQAEKFDWQSIQFPLYTSFLVGLLISLILFINQFPDYESDKAKGKRNWVVILGRKNSVIVYVFLMIVTYLLLILYVILGILPLLSLIVLLSIPLPVIASINAVKNYSNYLALIPTSGMTILTCLAFCLLLSISLFVSPFI